jgi:hypothetical protein
VRFRESFSSIGSLKATIIFNLKLCNPVESAGGCGHPQGLLAEVKETKDGKQQNQIDQEKDDLTFMMQSTVRKIWIHTLCEYCQCSAVQKITEVSVTEILIYVRSNANIAG